jgi:NAD(P)-dependent dehydrogenase (short-subunit alcohol dehydrogenase family)
MSRPLSERFPSAFVTGAGSGLGRAFTAMLLAEGVRVWGTSRDPARLAGPAGLTPVALDLADPPAAEAAFLRAAEQAGGAFDLVINNAGAGVFGEYAAVDFAVWQRQWDAMLTGTFRLTHAAWRQMQGRGRGCLVNVSSLAAEFPLPLMAGYNVAKAALSALSESLIFESRSSAVTVIDFRPGDYRTDFNRNMLIPSPAAGPRAAAVWRRLESNLAAAPLPAAAAADLRRALAGGRSGVVRSGSFFQARLGPLAARLLPAAWLRAVLARYLGGR